MSDHRPEHGDVGAYLLGGLSAEERSDFERHLASCAECRAAVDELGSTVSLLGEAGPADVPPSGLEARTFLAIERAASDGEAEVSPHRRRRAWGGRLRTGFAVAGAVAAVSVALLVGVRLGEDEGGEPAQEGKLELSATLLGPDAMSAEARVTMTGIGRIVAVESDTLPELDNDAEFYEVWFVGPGDAPASPNRVSAGTFHPDEEGRSSVKLTAAVVPKNYPVLSVTREPRNGDPRRTGPEVLRAPGA